MHTISTGLIKQELDHYKGLPHKARLLVSAYNLRSIAEPILSLFINAYIWRTTTSIMLVLVYSLGYFFALPLGFLFNGKLLKKFSIAKTHFIGNILSTLGAMSVIIFHSTSGIYLLVFGIIYGLGNGVYWSSRNYLSYQETNSKTRTYFFSIVSATGSMITIITSFSIGWIIAFSDISKLYSAFVAYIGVGIVAIISLFFAGLVLLKSDFKTPKVIKIWHPVISKHWNIVRVVNVSVGLFEAIASTICTLLILNFLGKEETLGTIGAIIGIFTIALYYLYGRLSKRNHHKKIFFVVLLISVVLASILALGNNNFTVLIYVLLSGLPVSFYWMIFDPWQWNIMDEELGQSEPEKYPLIVDAEIFLNIGRISGVLIFMSLVYFLSDQIALRIIPLVLSSLQIFLFVIIWKRISWKKI